MKILSTEYHGVRDPQDEFENTITVLEHFIDDDGVKQVRTRKLNPRFDLREHTTTIPSSSGFEWGYGGSGPAQLALALLADNVDKDTALRLYQRYKFLVVSRLPRDEWTLTSRQILDVAQELLEEVGHAS